jgi:Xaa-Pro aminopeptidase
MIENRIKKLRDNFDKYQIDGYVVPKNDEYFSEYSEINRIKTISNFSGSAGIAVILKKKNYLFVDGRYTLQAKIESGKNFNLVSYDKIINCNLFKNLTLGIDSKLLTSSQVKSYFSKYNKIKIIDSNLIDKIKMFPLKKNKPFYSLDNKIVGQSHFSKLTNLAIYLQKKKSDYIFISAPENVAWILNIRGHDNPNSPVPNCRLIITKRKKIYLIAEDHKVKTLINEKKIHPNQLIHPKNFQNLILNLKDKKFIIDKKSCSLFYEQLIKSKFKIIDDEDPTYLLKAIKNKKEINHMIKSHIMDGAALTKFLYWIKNINKKKITEIDAQNKLEKFRKKNKEYLFPSFQTIAGAGPNGAIVHYRAKKESCRLIDKSDIFLCDSGGQYKYGTTDVTRTICFSKPNNTIKNIFTKVLKGHIAVATTKLNKINTGKKIDIRARKFLKMSGLDYAHGTGHGVGFFLNVHEGPQSISKLNNVKILEGMIVSNEPGYYKEKNFGIRIENLVYVKKVNNNLSFKNLTLAPIDKDLINYKLLTPNEKKYLFTYHLNVYSKLSKHLTINERKWLASHF